MITGERMDWLADEAIKRFPIDPAMIELSRLMGNRALLSGIVRERVLWMLNQAYEYGQSDPHEH